MTIGYYKGIYNAVNSYQLRALATPKAQVGDLIAYHEALGDENIEQYDSAYVDSGIRPRALLRVMSAHSNGWVVVADVGDLPYDGDPITDTDIKSYPLHRGRKEAGGLLLGSLWSTKSFLFVARPPASSTLVDRLRDFHGSLRYHRGEIVDGISIESVSCLLSEAYEELSTRRQHDPKTTDDVVWRTSEDKARHELVVDLLRVLEDFSEDYPDRESILRMLRKREDQLFSLRE